MVLKNLNSKGFTLIELLVGIVLVALGIGVIYSSFIAQNNTYVNQEQVVDMQQNLRGAIGLLTQEIRMSGFDPKRTNSFSGIGDVSLDGSGNGTITFSVDWNEDGVINTTEDTNDNSLLDSGEDVNGNGILDLGETITYSLSANQLLRAAGGAGTVLAENIEGLAFAFAFDNDDDGELETTAGGNILWAIDSDGDGLLDKHLDTNDDGIIDSSDSTSGTNLASTAALENIRAVQIWMLAKSRISDKELVNSQTYVLGNQHKIVSDKLRRRLLTSTFACRNMGL
ncbi:MAG: PilW family protein [Deltaproteobacteria bacterium]|nr:PilW family protein [Deltaproteobacteria bacterium]